MSQCRVDVVHAYSRTPLEVLEVIITSTDDGPSLARWSLVSRVWSVIARKHCSRTVTISAREDGLPLATSLLCDPTSTVLPFVRDIRFEEGIDLEKLYEHDHPISRYIRMGHGTPFLDDILSAIRIVDLANLQSLEIVDLTWAEISEGSRRSFIKLCRPITSLSLICEHGQGITTSGLIEILGAITAVSSLQKFYISCPDHYIHRFKASDDPPLRTIETKATLPLRSLALECIPFLLPGLLAVFVFPHITDLRFNEIGTPSVHEVLSVLRGCAPNVEHL